METTIGTLIALGIAYFVYSDAKKKGLNNAVMWAVGNFFFCIVFFPLYWYKHMRG